LQRNFHQQLKGRAVTRFLLIRHGETHWNREQRIQGQQNSELSAEGLAQAQAAAACLAAGTADALVSSDLGRTLQTAAPISAAIGLPITQHAGLRERAFGIFEGCTLDEIAERFPEHHERWRARDPLHAMPGGESLAQVRARVKAALEGIAALGHRRVVAVTHGGVLDTVYRLAAGIPDEARRAWPLVNASFNHIDIDGDTWTLREWGVVSHLEGAGDEAA
jgi:probable phosphoglycerate mutase